MLKKAYVLWLFGIALLSPLAQTAAQTVEFESATYSVNEGGTEVTITVTISEAPLLNNSTVDYSTSDGTATAPGDYTAIDSGTLQWDLFDGTERTFTVTINDDGGPEEDETFNLTLSNPTGDATIGAQGTAVVTIIDNDNVGSLQFSKEEYSVAENDGQAKIAVERVDGTDGIVSVKCASSDDTAIAGDDYIQTSDTLEWGDGEDGKKRCIVPILDDSDFEGDETFNMKLSDPTGGAEINEPTEVVVTIEDDDKLEAGVLKFSEPEYSVDEGNGSVKITVTREDGDKGAVSVDLSTADDTAKAGKDYVGISGITLSWGDSETGDKTFDVGILDDEIFEGDEIFSLTLSNPTGGSAIGTPGTAVVTITDDEAASPGILQFSEAEYSIDEDEGSIKITVSRQDGSSGDVSVNLSTSDDTAIAGEDYIGIDIVSPITLEWDDGDKSDRTVDIVILDDENFEGDDETFNLTLSGATGDPEDPEVGDPAVVTIVDNDVPSADILQFKKADDNVGEDEGKIKIVVTRDGDNNGAISVELSTVDGSAKAGEDYVGVSGIVLSWADRDTKNKTFNINILNDDIFEESETFSLTLSNPTGGAELGAQDEMTVTIDNDDAQQPSTLQFSNANYSVDEDGGSVKITVTREGGSSGEVSVDLNTSNGSANAGDDYVGITPPITLEWDDGDNSDKTVNIGILDDDTFSEEDKTFNLTLSNPTGGTIGIQGTAVVTITENDEPDPGTLQFSAADYSIDEDDGSGSVTITVTREGGSDGAVSVKLGTTDDSAEAGKDYIGISGITLSWISGDGSGKTFDISILDDNNTEGNETFNLALSDPTGGAAIGDQGTAVATIIDDEKPPAGTLQFSKAEYSVDENGGSIEITVTRDNGDEGSVSVEVNSTDDTAEAGKDYVGISGIILSWNDGKTGNRTFNISILDNNAFEEDETFNLTLSNPTGEAAIGSPSTAVVTIIDNDDPKPGTLQFSSANYNPAESGGSIKITVAREGGDEGAVSVDLKTDDDSAEAGKDYVGITSPITLSWSDGDGSGKEIDISILDDNIIEGDETFDLILENPTGGADTGDPAVVTITDDDSPPAGTLQFSKPEYSVNEEGGSVKITVIRDGGNFGDVSVELETTDDSATTGADYIGITTPITLSWSDGDDSDKTINISILDDDEEEGTETFELELFDPTDGTTIDTAKVAIIDGETPSAGTLQFSKAEYSIDEGEGKVEIIVTRSGGSSGAISVDFSTADDSAVAGEDYTNIGATLSWSDDDSDPRPFKVNITDDNIIEGNETFNLELSNPSGNATLGEPSIAAVTIIDNDTPPAGTLQFSEAEYSVDENGGSIEVAVTRKGGSFGDASVECASSDGTAKAGKDYDHNTPSTLNWEDGDSTDKFCTVSILDDSKIEGDETFNLALSKATGATIGNPDTATVTIIDDEEPPAGTLQFSKAEYNVQENDGSVEITVTREDGSFGDVFVKLNTTDDSAEAGKDYISVSGITLSWGNGDTGDKTFNINILDDSLVEGDETFNLTLSDPSGGATIGDPDTAVITITDNDESPAGTLQFSKAEYSVDEDGKSVEITVTRENGSGGAVSVKCASSDGTATAGNDYVQTTSTLNWGNGDNADKSCTVPILDDEMIEGNETFNLILSNSTGGASIGDPDTTEVTIIDDEVPPAGTLQFSKAKYSVDEDGDSVEITVTREDGSSGAASVKVVTKDNTAENGEDYEKTTKKLKWDDGEADSKTFTVAILDDSKVEDDEIFKLKLKKAEGAELGSQIKAKVTIIDDDSSTGEPGTLQFSKGSYSVDENGSSVKITVERIDGSDGEVSVDYVTSDDSATEGDDYNDKTGTLSWDAQDSDDQTFKVRIIDDDDIEGNEIFVVSLGNATGGAELGNPDTVEVEIIDDEELPEVCDNVEQIPSWECEALVALYLDAGGNGWISNTNWIETNTPCSWYGVACSGGHVSKLTLYSNELDGNIPAELGDLSELQRLFLFDNGLSGEIPPELGDLAQLEYLWLHENILCGDIPDDLMDTAIPAQEGYLKLDDNQLATDGVSNDLEDWLNDRNSGWEDSQTGNGQCN
jgi:ribosomal protein L35AE/L33A